MINKYIKPLAAVLTGLILYTSALAQESQTLMLMKGMSQSSNMNPALHLDSSKVVISLPGLSGAYFDVNSPFALHDLIHKGTGVLADSLVLDIENFHNQLKSTNNIIQNVSMPLFYLGIRSKSSFFSFGVTENAVTRFSFDKSLVTFIKDGNAPYVGKNYDLGNLDLDAFHYREFALGYSNEVIKNKLTVGIKAKMLYGKFGYQTQWMNQQVETAADGTSILLKSEMNINMSGPVNPEFDPQGKFNGMKNENFDVVDYMLQKGNTGMSFDLGAVYKLNSRFTFFGSVIDMGKISFKKDLNNLDYTFSYKWEGVDFSHSVDKSQQDYVDPADLMEKEADKMEDAFKPKRSDFSKEAFSMTVPMKIYLGGSYDLNDKVNFGLVERLYKNGDFTQNGLTLSANTMVNNFFSVSGSYSAIGNSYANLGLGMAIRAGFFQFYMVTDNVLAIAPSRTQYANARFGVNLLFGRQHLRNEL
ncbi:MAG: DUF5723 family protein [Candidatus Saccharibacteria bacterium]